MDKLMEKLEAVYKVRQDVALGLIGNPGVAKSSMIYQFAEKKGVNVVEIIASQDSPTEISGMAIPDYESGKMDVMDLQRLLTLKDGDILFFDEFLNGNIQVLNACLTLITQRQMRSGNKLPDVMIVAAGNPQGATMMQPQTKQRFWWTEVRFNRGRWGDYILNKYGFYPPTELLELLSTEDFTKQTVWNYLTPRTAEQMIQMIAAGVEPDDPVFEMYRTGNFNEHTVVHTIAKAFKEKEWRTILRKEEITPELVTEVAAAIGVEKFIAQIQNGGWGEYMENPKFVEALKHIEVTVDEEEPAL